MSQEIYLTGITTTGTPHIGNYVGAIRPGRERYRETRVAGSKGLPVEIMVRGHVQAVQIDARGNHLRVDGAGLEQAARGTGEVAAAGVGDDDHIGIPAGEIAHLARELIA